MSSSRTRPTSSGEPVTFFLHDFNARRPYGQRQTRMRSQGPGGARRSRTDDILLAKQALYQLSYGPIPTGTVQSPGELSYDTAYGLEANPSNQHELVGPGRLELPTLRLSGVRSNHLSYGPMAATARLKAQARDRVTNTSTRMVDASMTKVERETETAASRSLLEPQ